jgi:hypothetical protein
MAGWRLSRLRDAVWSADVLFAQLLAAVSGYRFDNSGPKGDT